ncbi:HPP family protein [Kaarinaea lacus]
MHRPPAHIQWPPEKQDLSTRNILLSAICALITIGLVGYVSQHTLSGFGVPFMAASMGASAVLLFVVPASPLSHPWSFVGGHLVSAFIGITCVKLLPDLNVAGAIAVSGSIIAMYYLRCMHPPGGAAALLTVYGGDTIHSLGYQFLLSPLLLNLLITVICTMAYWKIANIRQRQVTPTAITGLDKYLASKEQSHSLAGVPFSDQDLSNAIAAMDTFVDITKEDLKEIFSQAVRQSRSHQLKNTPCKELMSPTVASVEFGTGLDETWQLLEQHNIRGMPVVDTFDRLIGIVTISDFISHARKLDTTKTGEKDISELITLLCTKTPGFESNKPEAAGQIMSHPVIFAREDDNAHQIMPLFSQHEVHHIPVVDKNRKLKGMLTRDSFSG